MAVLYFLLSAMRVECRYGTTRQIERPERTYPTSQCVERACVPGEIGRSPTTISCSTTSPRPGTIRYLPRVAARVFAQALTEIVRRLDDARTHHLLDQYALIGGFAVAAWGVPRATHDLDFALALGSADPAALSRHLNARFHSGEAEDPLRGVFQTTVMIEGVSIPTQLVVLPAAWNAIIFRGIEPLSVFGCVVPVVSWQSLILLKLYAGGPQDVLDAQQILAVRQPNQAEKHAVSALADRVGLSAAWQTLINP